MCPKQFITITEQKKHVRNHKEFTCEHCNAKFTRWMDLVQHRQTSHQFEGILIFFLHIIEVNQYEIVIYINTIKYESFICKNILSVYGFTPEQLNQL